MDFSSLENTDKKNASKISIAKKLVLMLYSTICMCTNVYKIYILHKKKKQ